MILKEPVCCGRVIGGLGPACKLRRQFCRTSRPVLHSDADAFHLFESFRLHTSLASDSFPYWIIHRHVVADFVAILAFMLGRGDWQD
jgi:hypothetical protein